MDDAAQRLWLLANRLDAAMTERIANDRARLAILVHRLDQAARAKPVAA
jgi:hypothetical protein